MKISISKNCGSLSFEKPWSVFIASEWSITETGVEKFMYLGKVFTSDWRQDEELDTRIGNVSAVMQTLQYSVVLKRELSKKAKLSIFKTVFVFILTYDRKKNDHKCKRPKWDFCEESKKLRYWTKCVALKLENLLTSSRCIFESKGLSLDGLSM